MGGFERTKNEAMVRGVGKTQSLAEYLDVSATEIGDPVHETGVAPQPDPRAMGYTGNTCMICEGLRMVVNGHCEVCLDCGNTTGCS